MSNQTNPDAGAVLALGKAISFRGAVACTKIRDTILSRVPISGGIFENTESDKDVRQVSKTQFTISFDSYSDAFFSKSRDTTAAQAPPSPGGHFLAARPTRTGLELVVLYATYRDAISARPIVVFSRVLRLSIPKPGRNESSVPIGVVDFFAFGFLVLS